MDFSRFHKIAPEATAGDLVVTTDGPFKSASSPWFVMYQGRPVTSADVYFCVRWVADFGRWLDRD